MQPEEIAKKILEVASENSSINGDNILITANLKATNKYQDLSLLKPK